MNDDEREKPPSNRDRMSDQADAAHEAAIARMQNDVHYANRFHALKAKATNPHDMVGYRVIRPVTQPVLNVEADTRADTLATAPVTPSATEPEEARAHQERLDDEKRDRALGATPLTAASVGASAIVVDAEEDSAPVSPPTYPVSALPHALAPSSEPHHATTEVINGALPRRERSIRAVWIGVGIAALIAGVVGLLWSRNGQERAKEPSAVAAQGAEAPILKATAQGTVSTPIAPAVTAEPVNSAVQPKASADKPRGNGDKAAPKTSNSAATSTSDTAKPSSTSGQYSWPL